MCNILANLITTALNPPSGEYIEQTLATYVQVFHTSEKQIGNGHIYVHAKNMPTFNTDHSNMIMHPIVLMFLATATGNAKVFADINLEGNGHIVVCDENGEFPNLNQEPGEILVGLNDKQTPGNYTINMSIICNDLLQSMNRYLNP